MDVLCTVIKENREKWKDIEATGEYRKFDVPATYTAPLSPLLQFEKCKIERKLNALQLNTSPEHDSETSDFSNTSSWLRKNGKGKADTSTWDLLRYTTMNECSVVATAPQPCTSSISSYGNRMLDRGRRCVWKLEDELEISVRAWIVKMDRKLAGVEKQMDRKLTGVVFKLSLKPIDFAVDFCDVIPSSTIASHYLILKNIVTSIFTQFQPPLSCYIKTQYIALCWLDNVYLAL